MIAWIVQEIFWIITLTVVSTSSALGCYLLNKNSRERSKYFQEYNFMLIFISICGVILIGKYLFLLIVFKFKVLLFFSCKCLHIKRNLCFN